MMLKSSLNAMASTHQHSAQPRLRKGVSMQTDLFSAASLACTIQVPPAPMLDIARHQAWPFPGSTPRECTQADLARPDGFPVFMYQAKEGAQHDGS